MPSHKSEVKLDLTVRLLQMATTCHSAAYHLMMEARAEIVSLRNDASKPPAELPEKPEMRRLRLHPSISFGPEPYGRLSKFDKEFIADNYGNEFEGFRSCMNYHVLTNGVTVHCYNVFEIPERLVRPAPAPEPVGVNAGSAPDVTVAQALEALDSMDDFARMGVSVNAIGPRSVLQRFIEQHTAVAMRAE